MLKMAEEKEVTDSAKIMMAFLDQEMEITFETEKRVIIEV